MKKYAILAILAICMLLFNSAFASKLPEDVWKFVKDELPEAQQRFDSVVTLPSGVMYIPLYPPANKMVEEIKIEYTYPEKKQLSQLPEVVLLNNGYSLLKVVKDNEGNYTLTKKDDLPIKVRLGIMPQDMLTPIGLKMPESLKLTLGDLLIPSKEETLAVNTLTQDGQKSIMPTVKRNEFIPAVELKQKKFLINSRNSKFLSVYDSKSKTPLYELKLSSMPLKIVTSDKSKVALVLYWSGKTAEIISLVDENVVGQIQMEANATDVALNEKENIAYITSQNAQSIYIVDLNSMQLVKVVKLDQKPSKITYCELDDTISFFDEFSQKIFNVTRNEGDFVVQSMGEMRNIAKVMSDVANIYAISRTQNELYVVDKVQGQILSTIQLDKKPTDAIMYGTKIFILCSKEGYLDIYDTQKNKLIAKQQLQKDQKTNFYSKITLIPSDKTIMITGINAGNYILFDLETMKLVREQESFVNVSNIIILEDKKEIPEMKQSEEIKDLETNKESL